MGQPVKIKKVSAYPIPAVLKVGAETATAQIVKLTNEGFLAETYMGLLQPGDKLELSFELPVLHRSVSSHGIVVKVYNHWAGSKAPAQTQQASAPATEAPSPSQTSGASNPAQANPATSGPNVVRLVEIHFQSLSLEGQRSISSYLNALKQHGT